MSSDETQATNANVQKSGSRGCLIAIAVAVFCALWLFSLGLNCLYPTTYRDKQDIHTFDGEPVSVFYLCREYVTWCLHPDILMFDLYPGYTRVDVTVKGKKLRCSIRDYLILFAVNVHNERCFLIFRGVGKAFHLYSAPLAGGEFTEVPLNTLPPIIAYANCGGVYVAEEYALSDKLLDSEEFYKTSTADLWHEVATGRGLYYPVDKVALERFKQQFRAARKEHLARGYAIPSGEFKESGFFYDDSQKTIIVYLWDGNSAVVYKQLKLNVVKSANAVQYKFSIVATIGKDEKVGSQFEITQDGGVMFGVEAMNFRVGHDEVIYQAEGIGDPGRKLKYLGGANEAAARKSKARRM